MISLDEVLDGSWSETVAHLDWDALEAKRKAAQAETVSRATIVALVAPPLLCLGLMAVFLRHKFAAAMADIPVLSDLSANLASNLDGLRWLFQYELVWDATLLAVIGAIGFFATVGTMNFPKFYRQKIFAPVWDSIAGVGRFRERTARRAVNSGMHYLIDAAGFLSAGETVELETGASFSIEDRDYDAHVLKITCWKKATPANQRHRSFSGAVLLVTFPDRLEVPDQNALLRQVMSIGLWGQAAGYISEETDRKWIFVRQRYAMFLSNRHDLALGRLERAKDYPVRATLDGIMGDLSRTIRTCRLVADRLAPDRG